MQSQPNILPPPRVFCKFRTYDGSLLPVLYLLIWFIVAKVTQCPRCRQGHAPLLMTAGTCECAASASQVYSVMKVDMLASLVPFASQGDVEQIIVDAIKHSYLQACSKSKPLTPDDSGGTESVGQIICYSAYCQINLWPFCPL